MKDLIGMKFIFLQTRFLLVFSVVLCASCSKPSTSHLALLHGQDEASVLKIMGVSVGELSMTLRQGVVLPEPYAVINETYNPHDHSTSGTVVKEIRWFRSHHIEAIFFHQIGKDWRAFASARWKFDEYIY